MGIYIKGVIMPKYGLARNISIFEDGSVRYYGGSRVIGEAIELPHHGRLIEADKLMANIRAHDYLLTAMCNSQENGMFTCGIQQAVDEADTIIPADPGGGADG